MFAIRLLVFVGSLALAYRIIPEMSKEENVIRCATELTKIALFGRDITLINVDYEDLVLKIYKLNNKIINKNNDNLAEQLIYNEAYVMLVQSKDFVSEINFLANDTYWNPRAPIILISNEKNNSSNILELFKLFSSLYAFNVFLIDKVDTDSPYLFMHDVNRSLSCRNISIIKMQCNEINKHYKEINEYNNFGKELLSCDTNIVLNGIFPLTFLKTKTEGNEFERTGYENVFFTLSEEYLNVKFKINSENERVGDVYENLTTTGLMKQIKDGKIDGITGGMLLLEQRAKLFDYIYTRFADFYVVVIPKSSIIEKWKAIFLTFSTSVWALIVIMFIGFAILCVTLNIFNTKDNMKIFLILFGYYFGFIGNYSNNIFIHRLLVVIWSLGAWLLICYFQSFLSSVFTSPIYYHQIQSLEEVIDLHFDLYINDVYRNFITASLEINFTDSFRSLVYCDSMLNCLRNVSIGGKRATITSYLYFQYHQALFLDEFGEPTLYHLPKPFNQMWLTTYIRKGHPKLNQLRLLEMQIIEGGFLAKSFGDVKSVYVDAIRGSFTTIKHRDLAGIYYILMSGWLLAFIIFVIEVCYAKVRNIEIETD